MHKYRRFSAATSVCKVLLCLVIIGACSYKKNQDERCGESDTDKQAISTRGVKQDIRELKLKDWQPRSMLKTKVTHVEKPAFPVIDVHNHLSRVKDVAALVRTMDEAGVETVVNLDGFGDGYLDEQLKRFDRSYPGRFLTYARLDFEDFGDDDWTADALAELERGFKAGAKGLKLLKSLGLKYRDNKTGKRIRIDDPRLGPIWDLCGRYGRPVEIHTADPAAFFTPLDRHNERWHELNKHPKWLFFGSKYPAREELLAQRNRVIARHPRTTFIGAHMANNPEDLETVGKWLDKYPNFFVDIDARLSELGRQPYSARRFMIRYQDRVMFGTDTLPKTEMYRLYYRFLETDDEYWDSSGTHHRQGFWMIYGLHLPRDVLEKIYYKNAKRVLAFSVHQRSGG